VRDGAQIEIRGKRLALRMDLENREAPALVRGLEADAAIEASRS